jgi:hypothetical protein
MGKYGRIVRGVKCGWHFLHNSQTISKRFIFSPARQIKHLQKWHFGLKLYYRKLCLDCPVAKIIPIINEKTKTFTKSLIHHRLKKTLSSYKILMYFNTF